MTKPNGEQGPGFDMLSNFGLERGAELDVWLLSPGSQDHHTAQRKLDCRRVSRVRHACTLALMELGVA